MFADSNSKGFWVKLKYIINKKSPAIDNKKIHPAQWYTHLKNLLKDNHNTDVTCNNLWQWDNTNNNENVDILLNGPNLCEEIIAGLKLKKGKSSGCDVIMSEFNNIYNPMEIYSIFI